MRDIEEKLLMIGVDLISDYLLDMSFRAENERRPFTAEDLKDESFRLKSLRITEIQKVKDRIAGRKASSES